MWHIGGELSNHNNGLINIGPNEKGHELPQEMQGLIFTSTSEDIFPRKPFSS